MSRNERALQAISRRQSGATMVEYIIIVAVIAIAGIAAWQGLQGKIKSWLENIGTKGDTAFEPK